MTDLPDRILAAIEQTAHVAEKARDAGQSGTFASGKQRWQRADNGDYIYTEPDGVTIMTGPDGLDTEVANHVLRNQPYVILRRCEADKRTVERHAPVDHDSYGQKVDHTWCGHCLVPWPCVDILDRADAYDIGETGEQT